MSDKPVCNYCGEELDLFDRQENFSIHKDQIGYGSAFDGDGVHLRLCCKCFDEIVSNCKVSPIMERDREISNTIRELTELWSDVLRNG